MDWEITLQGIVPCSGEPEESYRHHSPGSNASLRSVFQSVHRDKNSLLPQEPVLFDSQTFIVQ